jgi:hypothetical protein
MTFSNPVPLADAVARMNAKTPIAKALTSAEWADVPLAFRERAFWTARMARADVLQTMHDMLGKRLELETVLTDRGEVLASRDNFIVEMRKHLEMSGYLPPVGKEGGLQDHTSTGRLGMIFDINTQQAQEFARFKSGSDEGALDAFPCQELYRAEDRVVPRDWAARWSAAGGQIFDGGRMIAAKDDPIWVAISAFGTPFPPYDYSSGMDILDISRAEAEELGVIAPGQAIAPPVVGFNDSLQASVARFSPEIRADLLGGLGDQAAVDGDTVKFQGGGQ